MADKSKKADKSNIPPGRHLPKKESDLFKSIAKHYETKQYKKGLKAADQILKKYPDHGETQAMKGLVLNCVDRKSEAYDLVKKALHNDMKSHVCWHVYGLLHRSDHKYLDAIKSYKMAVRIDGDNMQILRDMSLLQVQMRDLEGFQKTRHKLLQLKPNQKMNWMAYAVSNQLAGCNPIAVTVIDAYSKTTDSRTADYEESELMLYRNLLLSEDGKLEEALEHLTECEKYVVDKMAWRIKFAELTLLLGRFEESRALWRQLLVEGGAQENYSVHGGWQCALLELDAATCRRMRKLSACDVPSNSLADLTSPQRDLLEEAYISLLGDLGGRCRAAQRIPLTFLQGEKLRFALQAYLQRMLNRGVPALAADLSALYTTLDSRNPGTPTLTRCKDPFAVGQHPTFQVVLRLCTKILKSLRANERFPSNTCDDDADTTLSGETAIEPPTSLLWCLFLHVQLLEARGDYEDALTAVQLCIDHTPTAGDFYERRARLLRKSGNVKAAANEMDAARTLDLADRYINNKTTKYMLRAGRLKDAMSTIALFTRHEGDPQQNLFEMQVMWVEIEYGEAGLRDKKYGVALKKFLAVEKHFNDFIDDQFDFHTYCLRKMTLRAYVSILQMNDRIQSHKFFHRAAVGAVKCYLAVFDAPKTSDNSGAQSPDYASMTPAQRKREKAKARKAAKKAADEKEAALKAAKAEEETNNKDAKNKKKTSADRPVDEDPLGDKLLEADPMLEAKRLVAILTRFAPRHLSTQLVAFDTAIRRNKPLLALRALVMGGRCSGGGSFGHPELIVRLADFAVKYQGYNTPEAAEQQHLVPAVREAVDLEISALLGGMSVEAYLSKYSGDVDTKRCLSKSLAAAKALSKIGKSTSVEAAVALIVEGGLDRMDVSVATCADALEFMRSELKASEQAEAWRGVCLAKYPRAVALGASEDLPYDTSPSPDIQAAP